MHRCFSDTLVRAWRLGALLTFSLLAPACANAGEILGPSIADVSTTQPTTRANPLAGARLWVDPSSSARAQADAWRATRPADADAMERIAGRSQADWLGDWSGDAFVAARDRTSTITAAGGLPVFVLYNIPSRDCSYYSAGGSYDADSYRRWIRDVADGIGTRRAAVILEPDALGLLDRCLTASEQEVRLSLLKDAVTVLKAKPGIAVYIDAGNAHWQPADVMAARLKAAGIDAADGFSLNVSNFYPTADNLAYGEALSALVGGKHFVIDTSRNGLGATADGEWCNASGRALGEPPTVDTGHPLADAFLWLKHPGESDGECNGGPAAGQWWADYALGLARRMPSALAMK